MPHASWPVLIVWTPMMAGFCVFGIVFAALGYRGGLGVVLPPTIFSGIAIQYAQSDRERA